MILIDTSAWVEFLRSTGSATCNRVEALQGREIGVCGPVRMEVLAGARDEQHLRRLRGLLMSAATIPTMPVDYDSAAMLYRRCRKHGATVRKLIDCLIGAIAIRVDAPVLHNDADFRVLARHTDMRVDTGD